MAATSLTALCFVAALLLVGPGAAVAQEPLEPLCLGCHEVMGGRLKAPTERWDESVHKKAGFSCEECHGGYEVASRHLSDPSANKPTIFRGKEIPGMCARCHTDPSVMRKYNLRLDQYPLYKMTAHWEALKAGNTQAATCISCHGVHGIKSKNDPAAPTYRENIPDTCGRCHEDPNVVGGAKAVVLPYWSGMHGRVLKGEVPGINPAAAPVCTDCHGVHRLHVFFKPEEEVEACASCHAGIAKQFRSSLHFQFIRAAQQLRCSSCHDPHFNSHPTVAMLEGDNKGHCGSCHNDQSERPLRVAKGMRRSILEVKELIGHIEESLDEVEHSGRFNDDWFAKLDEVKGSFDEVGPVVHSLDLIKVKEAASATQSQASNLHKEILKFRDDLATRRLGLYVALGIIFLNVLIVFIKLRSLPKDEDQGSA